MARPPAPHLPMRIPNRSPSGDRRSATRVAGPLPLDRGGPVLGGCGAGRGPGRRRACRLHRCVAGRRHLGLPTSGRRPLVDLDAETVWAIGAIGDAERTRPIAEAWERSREAPAWSGIRSRRRGDLLPTNLLVADGRVRAVIDFGGVGIGDPAADVSRHGRCSARPDGPRSVRPSTATIRHGIGRGDSHSTRRSSSSRTTRRPIRPWRRWRGGRSGRSSRIWIWPDHAAHPADGGTLRCGRSHTWAMARPWSGTARYRRGWTGRDFHVSGGHEAEALAAERAKKPNRLGMWVLARLGYRGPEPEPRQIPPPSPTSGPRPPDQRPRRT